jgi:hypothetical protein
MRLTRSSEGGVGCRGLLRRPNTQIAKPNFFAVVLQAEIPLLKALRQLGKFFLVGVENNNAIVRHAIRRAPAVDLHRVPLAGRTTDRLLRRCHQINAAARLSGLDRLIAGVTIVE